MITLVRLTASSVHLVHALGRTPSAGQWVEQVEDFVDGAGTRAALLGKSRGLVIRDVDVPIGAAILTPHQQFDAELLQAMLLGHLHRGRRLAKPALEAVLRSSLSTTRDHIVWLVHPDNEPMQAVSAALAADCMRGAGDDRYDVFIFDR